MLLQLANWKWLLEKRSVVAGLDWLHVERIRKRVLSNLSNVENRRQVHVRGDSIELGRVTIDPVECLDRQLEGTLLINLTIEQQIEPVCQNRAKLLNCSFSKRRRITNHNGSAIVLQCRSKNLGGRSTRLVDENDHRSVVHCFTVL